MNRWHADQENNMRPDITGLPCPFCAYDHGVYVDTELIKVVGFPDEWMAQAGCHECGAQAPDTDIAMWSDHPLNKEYFYLDKECERDVVNFAIKIWNCRFKTYHPIPPDK